MSIRRLSLVALLGVMLGILPVVSLEAAHDPWTGASTMLGGTARYDSGEWIHQDFVYDDYGADTQSRGAEQIVSLAPTSGDFRYPTDPKYGNNAADITEVRVQTSGSDLEVRVTMNTLLDESTTVLGAGVVESATPTVQEWPFSAGVASAWDRFVTVAAEKVRVTDSNVVGEATVDLTGNTIDFTIPDAASGGAVGLTVGAGLWDTKNGEWLAGEEGNDPGGTYSTGGETDVRVFDLAFNTREMEPRPANWMEDTQSDALAAGDVDGFDQEIVLSKLADGVTDPAITASGFYNRVFRSAMSHLDEGVNYDGFPQYNGLYQIYGLWIPQGYAHDPLDPAPLVLLLHSLSVHHNQYAGGALGESFRTLYEQLADGLGAITVTPLARGPDGWYWDEGLIDTLEVWEDARAHYAIDDDRTSVSGYSMGGYGTYRLSTMMPDRFAAAVSWVGPPAHQLWAWPADPVPSGARREPGNTFFQLESMRHVPVAIVHGTNDELVPVSGVVHQANRLHELGYTHRLWLHPGQDHFSFVFVDSWTRERDWFAGHPTVVSDPARVTFDVRPASFATPGYTHAGAIRTHLESLAGSLDSAYWVRDVAVATGGDLTGEVDLTSEGIGDPTVSTQDVVGAGAGVDEKAPTTPYLVRGLDRTLTAAATTADVLKGSLRNVTALTVDVGRAGLSNSPTLDIKVDQRVEVAFVRDGTVVGSTTLTP